MTTIYNVEIFDVGAMLLREPLTVVVGDQGDSILARIPGLALYARGDTEFLALLNLKREFVSTYDRLTELDGRAELGPPAIMQLAVMRRLLLGGQVGSLP